MAEAMTGMNADALNLLRWQAEAAGDRDTVRAVNEEFRRRKAETAEAHAASMAGLRVAERAATRRRIQEERDTYLPFGGAA